VRAILFDKTAATNWALGWHQDRTISVIERLDVARFGPWSVKQGMPHVAPPFALLSKMVTLRVHLDDVPGTNAPLLIAPGSHRLGCVPISEIDAAVKACGIRACTAMAGDIWIYATAILHASEATTRPVHRRVLQVDYAAEELPGGLRWLGV
jgi:ectoine hydroxylase-related dioxygenase (phytanoyl-CoA dioxygenase family)